MSKRNIVIHDAYNGLIALESGSIVKPIQTGKAKDDSYYYYSIKVEVNGVVGFIDVGAIINTFILKPSAEQIQKNKNAGSLKIGRHKIGFDITTTYFDLVDIIVGNEKTKKYVEVPIGKFFLKLDSMIKISFLKEIPTSIPNRGFLQTEDEHIDNSGKVPITTRTPKDVPIVWVTIPPYFEKSVNGATKVNDRKCGVKQIAVTGADNKKTILKAGTPFETLTKLCPNQIALVGFITTGQIKYKVADGKFNYSLELSPFKSLAIASFADTSEKECDELSEKLSKYNLEFNGDKTFLPLESNTNENKSEDLTEKFAKPNSEVSDDAGLDDAILN